MYIFNVMKRCSAANLALTGHGSYFFKMAKYQKHGYLCVSTLLIANKFTKKHPYIPSLLSPKLTKITPGTLSHPESWSEF